MRYEVSGSVREVIEASSEQEAINTFKSKYNTVSDIFAKQIEPTYGIGSTFSDGSKKLMLLSTKAATQEDVKSKNLSCHFVLIETTDSGFKKFVVVNWCGTEFPYKKGGFTISEIYDKIGVTFYPVTQGIL